jgi:hypothetical protein
MGMEEPEKNLHTKNVQLLTRKRRSRVVPPAPHAAALTALTVPPPHNN